MIATERSADFVETRQLNRNLASALEAWRRAIGEQHVEASKSACGHYGRSTSPWHQEPLAVLQPSTVSAVQEVVRIAAAHSIPLYPISGGKNWGLGDACPTSPGQVVVDLCRLNKIREVNSELCYAVIEAGVSQQQLYDYLASQAPNLSFDATGAGPNATIVGNVMERGYGHSPYGDRFHHSCNYEVVLADGQLLRTGFGHYPHSQSAHVFKAGLGPSLDGLFTQSNMGIVTAMTVWLMPRPERCEAFAFTVEDDAALPAIIDALRHLRLSGVLPSTVHIANDLRLISSKMSYPWELTDGKVPLPSATRSSLRKAYGIGAWNVLGGLYGTPEMVCGARKALRKALRGIATPHFINDCRLAWAKRAASVGNRLGLGKSFARKVASIDSAYELLKGNPVADHLRGTAWRSRKSVTGASEDPLDRGDGLIWLSPTLPMTGRDATRFKELAAEVFERYGFDLLATFVSVNGRGMCCPLTICYDASSHNERRQAADCYEVLATTMFDHGFHPYRLGIHSMGSVTSGSLNHWDVVRSIKNALDPQLIIAPHRYDGSSPDVVG